jgi:predicted DNA-binding protein
MVKKNLWLPGEMAEELRRMAYEERRTEAEIVREALRRYVGRGGWG